MSSMATTALNEEQGLDGDEPVCLNRKDVYAVLASRTGLRVGEIRDLLEALAGLATEQIEEFGRFEVPYLCRFRLDERAARQVVCWGVQKDIPRRQVLKTIAVKRLRDAFFSTIRLAVGPARPGAAVFKLSPGGCLRIAAPPSSIRRAAVFIRSLFVCLFPWTRRLHAFDRAVACFRPCVRFPRGSVGLL